MKVLVALAVGSLLVLAFWFSSAAVSAAGKINKHYSEVDAL